LAMQGFVVTSNFIRARKTLSCWVASTTLTGSVNTTWDGEEPDSKTDPIPRYPFDTQSCAMVLECEGNTGEFVELVPDTLKYLGPKDLTQYFIRSGGF
jgi:hypothetical protein